MKTGSIRNINKAEIYSQKSTSLATPEIHSMKSSEKSIREKETILPAGNQKLMTGRNNDKKNS